MGYPTDYKSKKKYSNKENVAYSVQGDNSKNQEEGTLTGHGRCSNINVMNNNNRIDLSHLNQIGSFTQNQRVTVQSLPTNVTPSKLSYFSWP